MIALLLLSHDQVSEVVPSSDPLVPVDPASTVETPEQDPTSFTDQVPSSSDPIIVETVEEEELIQVLLQVLLVIMN